MLPHAILSLIFATSQVVPLRAGEPAPFAGQLLDPGTAINLVRLGETVKGEADIAVRRAMAGAQIDRQRADALDKVLVGCNSELQKCAAVFKDCQREISSSHGMLRSPWFWFPIGLLAGTSAGIIFANRSRNF